MGVFPIQQRRMDDAVLAQYTGPEGEIVWNRTTKRAHYMDGSTMGGTPLRLLSDATAGEVLFTPQALTSLQRAQARWNMGTGRFESEAYFNALINPRQRLQQFSNFSTFNTAGNYLVDGWVLSSNGLSTAASLVAPPTAIFGNRLDLQFALTLSPAAAKGQLAASDYAIMYQPIEGLRMQPFMWGTAAAKPALVAFTLRSNFDGKIAFCIRNKDASRSYVHEIAVANGVNQFVSFVVPGDTAGTWAKDNSIGATFAVALNAGSTFQTSQPDTWLGGNFLSTPNVTNFHGSTANNVIITDFVMLPLSDSTVTAAASISVDRMPLFRRQDEDELQLCMRHYQTGFFNLRANSPGTSTPLNAILWWKTIMRAVPTLTFSNVTTFQTGAPTAGVVTTNNAQYQTQPTSSGIIETSGNYQADSRL